MTALLTLTNAATLKGYLMATDAPRAMILLAEQIVESATEGLSESSAALQRISNSEVKLPAVDLASAIAAVAKTAPSHDESRFAAPEASSMHVGYNAGDKALALKLPETPHAEEEKQSIDVDSGSDERASVTTGGAMHAKEVGRKGPRPKLEVSMLPAIEEALLTESFGVVGFGYGVTGQTVKNFLTKHGIDVTQYRKTSTFRHAGKIEASDGWPKAVKPGTKITPASTEIKQGDGPKVHYKTVCAKNSWGHEQEMQVVVPLEESIDPETGAPFTKYPPMYAFGAGPQKNTHVKGGS